jgi:predicted AAA+ superfamily ATPase
MSTDVAAIRPRIPRPIAHNGRVVETRELIPRHAERLVAEALADTRVVAVNGARQVGKSTLARTIAAAAQNPLIRLLDDPATLRAALDDPADFVDHDGLLVIDEVQLAPELFRAIKVAVDADPRPGRYLLTGSARILALRDLPDALPGRMETIELWPFSQGEIASTPDRFIDAAFAHGPALTRDSQLRRRDYVERVVRGGYPEAVRRSPRRRAAFFESYLTTLIERDVTELSVIERRGELRRLLALLAGRSGGLLVPGSLATQSGIPRTTLNRYLELLAAVFLIKQIPAWSGNHTQRAIGTPKLAYVDSGMACHLLGQDAARLGEPDGAAGPMLENFVLMELARQLSWADERVRLHHYRTRDRVEVDAVLESADGRIVGIEVKAGSTVRSEDLAGLRHLAERVGPRFVAGYVLYTGQQTLPFGERLRAMPIDALWTLSP